MQPLHSQGMRGIGFAVGCSAVAALALRFCSGRTVFDPRRPPAVQGLTLQQVETPALVVDMAAVEENMRRAEQMVSASTVTLRPIVKAHKCAALAKKQLTSPAARGVCCAKVTEAEAMLAAGIKDIFMSNEIIGEEKTCRLAAAMRAAGVTRARAVVDSPLGVQHLASAASRHDVSFDVLVEVSCGQQRCGVSSPEAAVHVGRLARAAGLRVIGIQAYQGAAQHIRDKRAMQNEIKSVAAIAAGVRDAMSAKGLFAGDAPVVVTGGGSGTMDLEMRSGVFTELQPGSYLFNDVDYSKNLNLAGVEEGEARWKASLFVLTTVMSATRLASGSGWAVVDAGIKAHSIDSGMPALYGCPEVSCVNGGDEHFKLMYEDAALMPEVGDKVLLQPGHVDPTFNMHDFVVIIRSRDPPTSSQDILAVNPVVENVWPIDARSPGL